MAFSSTLSLLTCAFSYTELPGGNIALPQGYSSILSPILKQIPEELILKQKPIKLIEWRLGEESDSKEGYESDGSDCSVRTVKSVEGAAGEEGDSLQSYPVIKGLSYNSLPASCISSRYIACT